MALLMHTTKPDNATKLRMAFDLMPASRGTSAKEFIAQMDAADTERLARGRDYLQALPDDEWPIDEGEDA